MVTVCVYVMLLPAATGFGVPLLVTVRSQAVVTVVVTVVLLFAGLGSLAEETEEFAVIVSAGTVGATLTTTMISTVAPAARLGMVQVTEAVTVHVHPAGGATETKVVLAGIGSVKLTVDAAAGPLFVTVCV